MASTGASTRITHSMLRAGRHLQTRDHDISSIAAILAILYTTTYKLYIYNKQIS